MVKGGKQQLKPTTADGDGRPAAEEQAASSEEQPALYELEAIRRKRMRKGVTYYWVKWLNYPESANTWEPRENLETYCSHVIESFEESLKTAKKSSCKRKRGAPNLSAAAATSRAEPLTRENSLPSSPVEDSLRVEEVNPVSDGAVVAGEDNNLHLMMNELEVSAATNEEQTVPEQGGPANDTLLSGRCIGARRRKSGIVKRFIRQPDASVQDVSAANANQGIQNSIGARRRKSGVVKRFIQQPVSAPNSFYGMATNQGIQNGISGISKTLDDSSRITELLNITRINNNANNAKGVLITFTAKRADGTLVPVDNKFLRANYPRLLIKFYEKHLHCTPHEI